MVVWLGFFVGSTHQKVVLLGCSFEPSPKRVVLLSFSFESRPKTGVLQKSVAQAAARFCQELCGVDTAAGKPRDLGSSPSGRPMGAIPWMVAKSISHHEAMGDQCMLRYQRSHQKPGCLKCERDFATIGMG